MVRKITCEALVDTRGAVSARHASRIVWDRVFLLLRQIASVKGVLSCLPQVIPAFGPMPGAMTRLFHLHVAFSIFNHSGKFCRDVQFTYRHRVLLIPCLPFALPDRLDEGCARLP